VQEMGPTARLFSGFSTAAGRDLDSGPDPATVGKGGCFTERAG
jgi:hypothetical protein